MNQLAKKAGGLFRGADGWWALAILLAGLAATAVVAHDEKSREDRVAYYEKSEEDKAAQREFGSVCREIQSKIEDRLNAHELILRSGAARFADTQGVTRAEWHEFSERQKISQKLPGIQGIGFAQLVPRQQLAQHTQAIRSEGFPGYAIKPAGVRETCSSIIYLEPFTGRNLRAFGYDMLTEPVRRAAMERARDQDEAALSGKVILVQETGRDVQAGTLMYVPAYRMGKPHKTVDERRAALLGWVYSPYRMTDLMEGILGRWDSADQRRIHLRIFDGENASPEALLYDSQRRAEENPAPAERMAGQASVNAAGRRWLLSFSQAGGPGDAVSRAKVWLVLGGGTMISLLLSGLVLSLRNTQFDARMLAERLTADLRQSEMKYRALLDNLPAGVVVHHWDATILFANGMAKLLLGLTKDQLSGETARNSRLVLIQENGLPLPLEEYPVHRVLASGKNHQGQIVGRRDQGKIFWMICHAYPVRGADGLLVQVVVTFTDITARKLAEEELDRLSQKNELLLSSTAEGILGLDLQGNHTFVNPVAAGMFGYETVELLGRDSHDLWHHTKSDEKPHPKDVCPICAAYHDAAAHYSCNEVFWRKDGTSFPVEYASRPLYEHGRQIGAVVTFSDITG